MGGIDRRVAAEDFAAWRVRMLARQRRRRSVERVTQLLALHLLVVLVLVNVRRTFGEGNVLVDVPMLLVLASLVTLDVSALLDPVRTLARVDARLRPLSGSVLRRLTIVVLVALYVLLLPFAATIGRRGYLRRRPDQAAWFSAAAWRTPHWEAKVPETVVGVSGSRRLLVMLGRVRSGGGLYLLVVALLVLVALSLNVVASSPKLAPFIYTLF